MGMRRQAVAMVGLVVTAVACSGTDSDDAEDRAFAAFDVCKQFVTDQLRSPATAEFRNYFEDDGEVVVTGAGDGPYTVRSSVDSENGFGALLRNDFICIVTPAGGDQWRLNDLTFDE